MPALAVQVPGHELVRQRRPAAQIAGPRVERDDTGDVEVGGAGQQNGGSAQAKADEERGTTGHSGEVDLGAADRALGGGCDGHAGTVVVTHARTDPAAVRRGLRAVRGAGPLPGALRGSPVLTRILDALTDYWHRCFAPYWPWTTPARPPAA
jgi:hypothetical protein